MSYADLLRDPRWIECRRRITEAAGRKCQRCGLGDVEMHVHHFWYRNGVMPWEYEDREMAAVCFKCHRELTDQRAALKLAMFSYESKFLPIDKVIKYLEAQAAWVNGNPVKINTKEEATGVANFIGCSSTDVIDAVGADGCVDPLELDALFNSAPKGLM